LEKHALDASGIVVSKEGMEKSRMKSKGEGFWINEKLRSSSYFDMLVD